MTEPISKEGKFLKQVFDQLELPKHPILAILVGQFVKLTSIVDGNPELQATAKRTFDFIKENWE